MSGFRPFVRQLGFQPGIQLNPLLDATDGAAPDNSDQILAVVARLTRGRIDRPFRVNRSNFLAKTGGPASLRTNALNEAKLQTYEALQNGAVEAVVQRLSAADAVKKYAVLKLGWGAQLTVVLTDERVTAINIVAGGHGYTTGQSIVFSGGGDGGGAVATIVADANGVITAVDIDAAGDGYTAVPTATVASAPVWSVSQAAPGANQYTAYLMHHDCHNDGVTISLHADEVINAGNAVSTKLIKIRMADADGLTLGEFEGSLDPAAKDDFNQTNYLPDLIAARSDAWELVVAAGATVDPSSTIYGRDDANRDKWVTSANLACFVEGSLVYENTDYARCIEALRSTVDAPFGYLISGGTQSVALIGMLANFAAEINTTIAIDVPGTLSAAAAITFVQNLNIDSHYVAFYWAPLEATDPLNGGKAVYGASGLQVGFRCARNARVNAKGFAPKNFPVAGKDWKVNRTNVRQLVRPDESSLSDLAKAKINPVIFETYTGGGGYVYFDALTAAKSTVSYKKLIAVAEMSSSLDNAVTMYANELKHLPMAVFIRKMEDYLDILLTGAAASGWLVPSKNLPGNAPFQFQVVKSEVRPADLAHITYWCSYDGTARQAIVQQALVK